VSGGYWKEAPDILFPETAMGEIVGKHTCIYWSSMRYSCRTNNGIWRVDGGE
jgi:hypothetical protein